MQFIPNTETYTVPPADATDSDSVREPVRILVIGSAAGISMIVSLLHRLGFAEATAWSKPQVDPISGKPMRIFTKWIRR